MKKVFLAIACFLSLYCFSQKPEKEYATVDDFVKKLGPLDSINVATIADTITRPFENKEQKARAIFYWIANNISLDPKAIHSNDNKKTNPVTVIQSRKATSLGFAMLVQEMCSQANIRCLVVDGYTKNSTDDINNRPDAPNHSWNVVQLGKSPEDWYYIDAASASGSLDKKQTVFTRLFTSTYFFAEKVLFNLDHYPDNSAWLLGEGTKSLKDFYSLPVIHNQAHMIGMKKPSPITGFFKTKMSGSTRFSFKYDGSLYEIKTVELLVGEENKKPKPEMIEFIDNGAEVSFTYKFKKDDTYPVKIVVNGEVVLEYMVEVTE